LLAKNGTLIFHIEPKVSHHIRYLLDEIFEEKNFRNEIVLQTMNNKKSKKQLTRQHDVLIAYTKSSSSVFNYPYTPYDESYKKKNSVKVEKTKDETGQVIKREYVTAACHNAKPASIKRPNLFYDWKGHKKQWWWSKELMQERHDQNRLIYNEKGIPRVKKYLDEMPGIPLRDIWTDLKSIKNKLDYATQKSDELLERLVLMYTNEGDEVLDPYAGSGTTGRACIKQNRSYLLVDISQYGKEVFEKSIENVK
jgi:site-specific DNA-methyltransferase (adenine-specific)